MEKYLSMVPCYLSLLKKGPPYLWTRHHWDMLEFPIPLLQGLSSPFWSPLFSATPWFLAVSTCLRFWESLALVSLQASRPNSAANYPWPSRVWMSRSLDASGPNPQALHNISMDPRTSILDSSVCFPVSSRLQGVGNANFNLTHPRLHSPTS